MKGILCYYSITGNTEHACRYVKSKLPRASFELHDIVGSGIPDFGSYDIVGFATWTELHGVPTYFHSFFEEMPYQPGKPAFVFNTYAMISGGTLKEFAGLAISKGFNVISGHSLRAPESGPLLRKIKLTSDHSPLIAELKRLDGFIARLDSAIEKLGKNEAPGNEPITIGLFNVLFPPLPRKLSKKIWGRQKVDPSRCIQCGACRERCAYGAIRMEPWPVFNHERCHGCCSCYNHCPRNAIYTAKVKKGVQRSKPNQDFLEKLRCV